MSETSVTDVDSATAIRQVGEGIAILIDVRRDDEWDAGHAAQATHIPIDDLESRLSELPRDTTIICTCRGGGRATRAAKSLLAQGYKAVNLEGGMNAWHQDGLPLESENGDDPRVL